MELQSGLTKATRRPSILPASDHASACLVGPSNPQGSEASGFDPRSVATQAAHSILAPSN